MANTYWIKQVDTNQESDSSFPNQYPNGNYNQLLEMQPRLKTFLTVITPLLGKKGTWNWLDSSFLFSLLTRKSA